VIKGEKDEKVYIKSNGTGAEIYGGGRGIPGCDSYGYKNGKGDIHTNPNCPCRIMDEQSGESKSSKRGQHNNKDYNDINAVTTKTPKKTSYSDNNTFNDTGGASRFFYQAKVSKKERNMGLNGFEDKEKIQFNTCDYKLQPNGQMVLNTKSTITKNNHPTLKPVQLMTYLCRLVTPPNGIVLDPFMGSGSTGIAALLEGFQFIGMEMDEEYFNIAQARINSYEQYTEFIKK
jgi:DNA modification methylase